MDAMESEAYREALQKLGNYAMTCEPYNTTAWMRGLADRINQCLVTSGDKSRCTVTQQGRLLYKRVPV